MFPLVHGAGDFGNHRLCLHSLDAACCSKIDEIASLEIVRFSRQTHLVATGPFTGGVERIGDVKSGCETPLALWVHEERNVLDVIVLVSGHDVEQGSANLLLDIV